MKVHGSALEYIVKRDPERFLPWAREGLAGARAVLVGSRHTAESLWAAMDDPGLPGAHAPRARPASTSRSSPRASPPRPATPCARWPPGCPPPRPRRPPPGRRSSATSRRPRAALATLDPERDRLVAYVGKLIVSKGVDLLAAAWPLVLARVPEARLVVVGFGAYREGFERLLAALAAGDLDAARALAAEGRGAEGGPAAPLRHLTAFLDTVDEDYLRAAARLPEQVVLAGRLEHDELVGLLPACEAQVVPSTFPEAFGMVAAEAAACGVLPVSDGPLGPRRGHRAAGRSGPARGRRLAVVLARRRPGARARRRARRAGSRRRRRCAPRPARRSSAWPASASAGRASPAAWWPPRRGDSRDSRFRRHWRDRVPPCF